VSADPHLDRAVELIGLAVSAIGRAQLALASALTLVDGALASGFVRPQIQALWTHATSPRSGPDYPA